MRTMRTAILLTCALLVGCNVIQEGKHSVNGNRAIALQGQPGELFILSGFQLDSEYQPVGAERGLLHVLIFEDGTPSVTSSHVYAHEKETSRVMATYSYDLGREVIVELLWNRASDVVTVSGSSFNRDTGNCVIVVIDNQEIETVAQVPGQIVSTNPADVLDHIRDGASCCSEELKRARVRDGRGE